MHRILIPTIFVLALVCPALCVSPETWRQSEFADFEKATLKNVSLRSDGRLSLAPAFTELLDSSLPYFWSLAEDSKGNVYAGGGGPGNPGARVYVIPPGGKGRVFADLDALEVHALAVDRADRVYAATSPDAKVFRIGADGKPELFYDPIAKYIWAMVFDAKGNLYVATGDQGLIHRVAPDGKGSVFYRTEETHARSLAIGTKGDLIAGTEPDGLVIRVSPEGKGFVLYETPKREVTSVTVASDGTVYAAAAGNKLPTSPAPQVPMIAAPAVPAAAGPQAPMPVQTPVAAPPPPSMVPMQPPMAGGSELYRVDPDGYASRVWSHAQAIAYAVVLDDQNRPLIATGNKGAIYRVDSEVMSTLLVSATPKQVTGLLAGRQRSIYAATGNIAKVYRLGPDLEREGTIESDVLDASLFSLWGRLIYTGAADQGLLRFETRSGNLDRPRQDWSPWAPVKLDTDGGRVTSPSARFLQWKLTLTAQAANRSPSVDAVSVIYLPRNVPPVIQQIEMTAANYRFPAQALTITPSRTLTLQPMGRARRPTTPVPMAESGILTMQYEKGQIGARWLASDENGDDLVFKVEIRGSQETEWHLLKDKIKERHLSWDSTAFPDGEYRIRVTASDSPDNPPGQELTAQLAGPPFLIDNSPPEIAGLTATRSGARLEARWRAKDAYSCLQEAEYSLDGGDWFVVEPTTKVSDSQQHDYVLTLTGLTPGEHTLAVRVTDDYDNQTVAKAIVR